MQIVFSLSGQESESETFPLIQADSMLGDDGKPNFLVNMESCTFSQTILVNVSGQERT